MGSAHPRNGSLRYRAVEMALFGTKWHGFGGGLSQKAKPNHKLGRYYREVGTLSPGARKKTSRKSQGLSRPVQTKRASNRRKRRQRSVRTQAKAAARKGTESPKSSQTGAVSCSYHTHIRTHTRTRFQPSHDPRRSKSRSRIGQASDQFQDRRKCGRSNLAQSHFCAMRNSTRPVIAKEGASCICK